MNKAYNVQPVEADEAYLYLVINDSSYRI